MFRTLRPHKSHDMKRNELYSGNSYCTQCGLLSTKEAIERPCRHEATQRIEALELALHRIAGHGNITGDKAREIAAEALGIKKPE